MAGHNLKEPTPSGWGNAAHGQRVYPKGTQDGYQAFAHQPQIHEFHVSHDLAIISPNSATEP